MIVRWFSPKSSQLAKSSVPFKLGRWSGMGVVVRGLLLTQLLRREEKEECSDANIHWNGDLIDFLNLSDSLLGAGCYCWSSGFEILL